MTILLVSLNAKYIHSSLALRSIEKYCKEYKKHLSILEMTINHEENEILKEIYEKQPEIIGFSCYIWNMSIIKTLLPTLRKILPHTTFILGGPEVSYQSEYLLEEMEVDIIMEGEGEQIWKDYLAYQLDRKGALEDVPGIVYKCGEKIVRNRPQPPMNLEQLPFVYENLEGLEHRIIYYEASRGCPFNCQYCLSSVEAGVRFLPTERVLKDIQYFLDQKVPQIKFVDRTFNANKKYAKDIWKYIIKNDNDSTNFHFEIAAELLDEESFEILKGARVGLIQFEIGVQSTNLKVLDAIKRKMPFEDIKKVVEKIKALGNIHQHLDLIAGLPLEDYNSFKKSFNDVLSTRPEQFQLGFLKLLRGSGLRNQANLYGIVYKDEPPYEVLYTKDLSYKELLKLHAIEEMVERYYNTERFHTTLEYAYTLYQTPFDFYEAFSFFWKEKGYDKIKHQKQSYYIYLAQFLIESEKVPSQVIKELIRFDWYSHEFVKDMPDLLRTIDQSVYKEQFYAWIKYSEQIQNICPAIENIEPRQRVRKFHLECFSYDMEKLIKGQYRQLEPKEYVVLFDYTQKETRIHFVTL